MAIRQLAFEDVGDVTVVRFRHPKVVNDCENIQWLADGFDHLIEGRGRVRLAVDLAAVEYFESVYLGKLITADRKARAAGGRLVVCNPNRDVNVVFQITRLDCLVPVLRGAETVELARRVFAPDWFAPAWRTDTAVALARAAAAGDHSAVPILGDALQDAGCDDDNVLAHCRRGNLHLGHRCWVIEAVLGTGPRGLSS